MTVQMKSRIITRTIDAVRDACHGLYPFLGALIYRFPSRKLCVIGVTGTDGKSSTVMMLATILEQSGHRTASFSSIQYSDGRTTERNTLKMTTPGRMFLQRFLSRSMKNGCTHAVLEITSEGIKQNRHRFIGFDLVVLTNVTPEHIERHGGFDRYLETKLRLVRQAQKAVINLDDSESARTAATLTLPLFTHSMKGIPSSLVGTILKNNLFQSELSYVYGKETHTLHLKLGGPFAPQNATAAIAASLCLGVSLKQSISALESLSLIPGRFDIIGQDPLVIVDYAHTTNAVAQILRYIKERAQGRLIHVFGAAGGGRDTWKRKELAELSERYADMSILTEENPFDEEPEKILTDITSGFSPTHLMLQLPHREDAVRRALELAKKEDVVLLTAKGSETVIAGPNRTRRPYEERAYVSLCLQSIHSKKSQPV
ncbi:MAG: hypothetical protein RLY47_663 [Candidatus Parcubacteria bacterium]